MDKLKSFDDLQKMREKLRADLNIRENSNFPEKLPQIRVSMGTCGIAAGAKETMARFVTELAARNIDAVVTQTGCMGHCQAEPVVEIILPDREAFVFGDVTPARVSEIIETYIVDGKPVEGVLSSSGHPAH